MVKSGCMWLKVFFFYMVKSGSMSLCHFILVFLNLPSQESLGSNPRLG